MQERVAKTRFVSPAQASYIFSVSIGTLARLRYNLEGPRYFKIGRSVRYCLADLEAYFMANPVNPEPPNNR